MAGEVFCLVCAKCNNPAATKASLLPSRTDTSTSSVYPYELAVLDVNCWCYSATATSGSDDRFDLVCTQLPSVAYAKAGDAESALGTVYGAGPELPAGSVFHGPPDCEQSLPQ